MINVNNVSLRFGNKVLFENVNLKFNDGACYGLIGANGCGKSTFIRLLNGDLDTTSGEIIIPKNERVSTLEQDHYKYDDYKVLDVVIMGHKKLYDIKVEKEELYTHDEFSEEDGIRLGELEADFMELNGWEAESEAGTLLSNLGVLNKYHDMKMSELDNTDKVKVLLAKSLFQNPDILLLDEPTNHLDIDAINWLSEFIINYPNCVIVVSHDRHFLNNVCTNIVDIDYKKMTLYAGNYDFWRESSELLLKQIKEANRKKEDKINELKEFIARFQANASKSRQATSRKKILEKIELEEIIPSSRKYPFIEFKFEKGNGPKVLTISDLTLEVGGKKYLNKISLEVLRGDKIALLGSSVQRTMLFEVLMKNLKYKSGEFKWGMNVKTSYFKGDNTEYFSGEEDIISWISSYIKIDDISLLRSFLGRMLFSGEDVFKQVKVLSGGEKARCMLSKMMLENPNVLLLDEPTNHLDLESITSLNTAMKKFEGEIIFASQDYELNETVANRIIEICENGTIIDRRIPYSEYMKDLKVKELREKNRI